MSQSSPTIVKLASQFSGQHRSFPKHGGNITQGELQSLAACLRQSIKTLAQLTDTVDQIRARALFEQKQNQEPPS